MAEVMAGKIPPWPAEARKQAFVKDYIALMYIEQTLGSLKDRMNFLKKYYADIIDLYEKIGGEFEIGKNTDGTDDLHQYIFILGYTKLTVYCNDDLNIREFAHQAILDKTPVTGFELSEIEAICIMLQAIMYKESPREGKEEMIFGMKMIRNSMLVDGMGDLQNRCKTDTYLLQQAIAGANLERVELNINNKMKEGEE